MPDRTLTEHLDFLVAERGEDEATVIALALQSGIEALYREALTEAFLLGKVSKETALKDLGTAELREIELQRDALRRDVEWGRRSA
jgi:hypothetical protein